MLNQRKTQVYTLAIIIYPLNLYVCLFFTSSYEREMSDSTTVSSFESTQVPWFASLDACKKFGKYIIIGIPCDQTWSRYIIQYIDIYLPLITVPLIGLNWLLVWCLSALQMHGTSQKKQHFLVVNVGGSMIKYLWPLMHFLIHRNTLAYSWNYMSLNGSSTV